jgi:hypothetical protein
MSRKKIKGPRQARKKREPIGAGEALRADLGRARLERNIVVYDNLRAMHRRGVLELDRVTELKYTRDVAEMLGWPHSAVVKMMRRLKNGMR